MRPTRPAGVALLGAGLLAVLAGCGGAATPAAPPASPAATATADVCTNLLRLDSVPSPDGGPEGPPPAAAVREWGTAIVPFLDAALAQAPAALRPALTALQPVAQAAATEGVEPNLDDPQLVANLAAYETWAHESCGYQQIALVATDFRFTGAPTTLDAGPVSVLMRNESTGGQFHVALLAKPRDPAMTIDQFVALPMEELFAAADIVPGAAAAEPGQTGGFLADLEPGRYFLFCPVGEEGQPPHHLQGMINEVTVA